MVTTKKFLYVLILGIIIAGVGYFSYSFFFQKDKVVSTDHEKIKKIEEPEVTFAAFGDTMMHEPQIKDGKTATGYNFNHVFKEVKSYLSKPDIAIGNFEMTLAGPSKPYNGYPLFNAPDQIVDALLNSGVDVMSTANNHAIDTGAAGLKRTYQQLSKKGLLPVGTASKQEEQKPTIVEKNNIKIGFLAYTEHTNGNPVPQKFLVNKIQSQQIAKDIKQAKTMGAKFVVVSLHFGVEYQRQPNEFQQKVAHQALKDGADVILGSHPHVLQPMEKVMVNGKQKLIIYSMGNFISNQSDTHTDEGIILFFKAKKDAKRGILLQDISYLPTMAYKYTKGGKKRYVVIPEDSPEPKQLGYPGLQSAKWKSVWNNTTKLMKQKGDFPTFAPQP
ncbi:poly-gamma-glutamate synthesis protein (capsule biosynthesis protein) [Seinonella peptonophila]|uniref:Poly-gamma-glutamate synthesis protein (Capsule biosynthesis protein) n=1 Tax=Seinonella peptonophila TaxID=112248 RepID=A0A1M4T1A3_9BACL|nr:CapA family protein [Seinonella peptonophila]SHE38209.1 poly-gamma-glutamate synthesis protein (capsule biosynthesis protein) [Seinonella peptonophila]